MEYVTIKGFTDVLTSEKYVVGDRYPHRGFAKKERVEELSTTRNKRGIPLIAVKKKKAEPKTEPKVKQTEETKEEPMVEAKKPEEKKGKSQKK